MVGNEDRKCISTNAPELERVERSPTTRAACPPECATSFRDPADAQTPAFYTSLLLTSAITKCKQRKLIATVLLLFTIPTGPLNTDVPKVLQACLTDCVCSDQ